MQSLTAPPRESLTEDQVFALLTGDEVTVAGGLELLDGSNTLVEDVTDDLDHGEVSRENFADVHGTCRLTLTRELAWGRDRLRPYMTLAANVDGTDLTARFNLGVFVMTTPDSPRGEDPVLYDVVGYDLLHLLQAGPGDTYVVDAGTTYFAGIQSALAAAGLGVTVQLDGTRQASVLTDAMVWALTPDQPPSWLRIVNDLLDAIGYRGLWMNQDGVPRSGPYLNPSVRPVEWTFDTSNSNTNLVGTDRSLASDVWAAHNWWRFVRKGMATRPVEGDGIYTVTNPSDGRTSVAALGRTVRADVHFVEAVDQASLVTQGDRAVAADQSASRTFTVMVEPLPIAGHFDVVQLDDEGESDKCQVTSWTLPLDGSQGRYVMEATEA